MDGRSGSSQAAGGRRGRRIREASVGAGRYDLGRCHAFDGAGPDNSIGGDRFRLRMSLQEKRAEEAGMISLTMPCKKTSAKVNSQRDLALAA
jgi:hypothetical protein